MRRRSDSLGIGHIHLMWSGEECVERYQYSTSKPWWVGRSWAGPSTAVDDNVADRSQVEWFEISLRALIYAPTEFFFFEEFDCVSCTRCKDSTRDKDSSPSSSSASLRPPVLTTYCAELTPNSPWGWSMSWIGCMPMANIVHWQKMTGVRQTIDLALNWTGTLFNAGLFKRKVMHVGAWMPTTRCTTRSGGIQSPLSKYSVQSYNWPIKRGVRDEVVPNSIVRY